MVVRRTLFALFILALPLAVDLPARGAGDAPGTRVEVAGGGGQFALVSRGCNGEVLRVTHEQIRSGALVVEERLPHEFVVGVRAGAVREPVITTTWEGLLVDGVTQYSPFARDAYYTNHYANPYVAYEGHRFGAGIGPLVGEHDFLIGPEGTRQRVNVTGHLRFGSEHAPFTIRWFEDVPLESDGHLTLDFGLRTPPRFETGVTFGLLGPWDGALIGLHGRVWLTPAAALQLKAAAAEHGQYGVWGGVNAEWPPRHASAFEHAAGRR